MSNPTLALAPQQARPAVTASRIVRLWCDDATQQGRLGQALAAEGLRVDSQAGEALRGPVQPPDAVVLHLAGGLAPSLPRLRTLRALLPRQPLLVALRGLRELDQVLALEMGADDVVDLATSPAVVAARLRALWRRADAATGEAEPPELCVGSLRLSRWQRRAWCGERELPLTEGEFAVLWLLAARAGMPVSRDEILRRVRGLDAHPLDRSIDSRVYRLRGKLGAGPGGQPRIRTVRHVGYLLVPGDG